MYFDKKNECMSRDELTQLQLERLQSTLYRLSRNVPFYRKKFEDMDLDVDDVRTLDDVRQLPYTSKSDLRDNYPYDMFAVPMREVVRLHASSGTTGKAVVVGYTKNDVKRWAQLAARVLTAGGVTKDDVVQIAFGYGLFTGGFGFHYGAELLGASVVPSSSGNTDRQIQIIQDYKTTALLCTPGYALYLAEAMRKQDINTNALTLKRGLFGGEAWSEAMRGRIQDGLKLTATDNYGLSEIMGPGVAGECLERGGLHINEDHFLAEIIDPETLEPVPEGEVGELVLTTLTKEAFPMLRFRTGDLTRLIPGQCPCGRTHMRIDRIQGRTDDMFILKGINVYPKQVENVLAQIEGVDPCYQVILERDGVLDKGTVMVEAATDEFFDEIKKHQQMCATIRKRLESVLGVGFDVRIVERSSLFDTDACKTQRVVDKRTL
ncbi:phenylacetate--CoA ligase family protein [Desulfovibrio ferrophilus]|uniref:Phenylacetate-coenzyme A ligase n=1 Tax=Desulfovibrio ferrophilus TaxID=241368 RepID=A0A2Z6B3C2_9BACT|nr:phenylacetate--CoA ligase [Desulfovibrio ferrophilus]BBD10034.1 phenylacetate--CoA ligase [Desulfovibrio ferrophilus]